MVDRSIFLGLALLAGSVGSVRPGATAFAVLVTLAASRRHVGRWMRIVSVVAVVFGGLRARSAVARFDRGRAEVRALLGGPARCAALATVSSSPVLHHSSVPTLARSPGDLGASARSPPDRTLIASWEADLSHIECEGRPIARPFPARIYGGPDDLSRGDQVEIIATLAPVQLFWNEDLPDPRPGGTRRRILASGGAEDVRVVRRAGGLLAAIDRFRAYSRRRIEATFATEAAPMARALVLGESDLEAEDDQAFRASGLAHLLAVSGTHLVLVVSGAVLAMVSILRRITWASSRWEVGRIGAGCGAAFAWLYADFAGGSGSAIRAAAMLSFALAARALGQGAHGPRAFGLSLVGIALVDPLVAFDLSFLLSVAATAGLMLLQSPIALRLAPTPVSFSDRPEPSAPKRIWRTVSAALATTLSATIGCAPILAFISPTLPIGGVVANLFAVPLGELLALPLCLSHVLIGFAPMVERGDALVASGTLLLVRGIARTTQRATWLALEVPQPSAWQAALLWSVSAVIFFGEPRRRRSVALLGATLLALSEVVARRDGRPRDQLRVSVLDVGQGDASIVDLPDGQGMLIDGGGLVGSPVDTGQAVIAPLLRVRRRSELAVVVLSHPHPDHFGGLASALAGMHVGEFWDTGQGEREGAGPVYAALLASLRARGVPIVRPSSLCGHPRAFGAAQVEVLAPCPDAIPFVNANDNSFVIRVTLGRRTALLVGDAERAEEETLLADRASSLRANFLKVGHHGSATSSSEAFVAAVGADDAAISCGVRNRFGHPHSAALRALSACARVHRTDQVGSIVWQTDGTTTSVAVAAWAAPARLGLRLW